MGRKSNNIESYKRKTKKVKRRRKKELFGKYRLTREGDTIASKKPKNQKKPKKETKKEKKSKKNFSKSSQNKKSKK